MFSGLPFGQGISLSFALENPSKIIPYIVQKDDPSLRNVGRH